MGKTIQIEDGRLWIEVTRTVGGVLLCRRFTKHGTSGQALIVDRDTIPALIEALLAVKDAEPC